MDTLKEFQKMKSINNDYKSMRLIAMLSIISTLLITGFAFAFNYKTNLDTSNKISSKLALLINTENIDDNRPIEIKSHLKILHGYLFNLEPDPAVIKENMRKARFLGGDGPNSIESIHIARSERDYYSKIIQGNISTYAEIDSIIITDQKYPYEAMVYGKEKRVRANSTELRNLQTLCTLRNVTRSDNNEHGLFVETLKVIDNSLK